MSKRRVVITGMGCVSCVGNDVASTWDSVVNGRCGLGKVTLFDATDFINRYFMIYPEVKDYLDKFYIPHKNNIGDYKLDVSENEEIRNIEISIDKIEFENAQEKLWQKQSLYYVQKFNVLVGKSVIVGVWALALICLNVMYIDFFSTNLSDYTFAPITIQSFLLFSKLLFVVVVRFLICYYIIEVFYNTIRIISSMVNFMSVRIKRQA